MRPRTTPHVRPDRSFFDACPIALLEEDIRDLRSMIDAWRRRGIVDLDAHLRDHPDELRAAIRAVKIIDANPAACRLHEVDGPEALRGPLGTGVDLDDPYTLESFRGAILAIAEGVDYVENASLAVTPDGRRLEVEARVHVPAAGQDSANVLVALVDMAAHRRLEREIEGERTVLRTLVDAIPDQVFLKDREGTYRLVNQALAAWAGAADPGSLVGKTDLDLFPAEIAQKFRADDREIMEHGAGRENIEEQIGSGSRRRWALTTKVPVRDARGDVTGVVGIVRDIDSLRRTEDALRESERRYRAIVEEAPVGIFRTTSEGTLLEANPALARMTGHDSPDVLREAVNRATMAEVLYWDPSERDAIVTRARESGAWQRMKAAFRHRDGRRLTVTLTFRGVGRPASTLREIEGFVEDITEQARVEEAFAREHALLATLMDTLPDGIYFKDLESRFIRVNRAQLALFGLDDPSRVIGRTDADFFTPEHAAKARADEVRIIRTGEALVAADERLVWPDRPDTWVSTTKLPLRDARGTIVGTFGVSRDITDRRRLEEKNLALAALVESSGDAIVGLDIARRVTSWNRGAERIYGYTAAEAIGQPATAFIPPGQEASTTELRERSLRGEYIENYETVRLRKDGKIIRVSLSLSPVRDPDGKLIGTASIVRDITTRKALEAQAMRVQRLESLRILAAGVAHQFNNINATILGYLDVLAEREALSEKGRGWVDLARRGIRRAADITERMQGLSGAAPATGEVVDVRELIEGTLEQLASRTAAQDVQVVRTLEEGRRAGMDRHQLEFVIVSLVTNALDAMLEAPRRVLTIGCRGVDGGTAIEVADSGCGITAEGLSRIFTPFYSTKGEWAAAGSPEAAVRGVGLSLAVCQSLIIESGGRIDVDAGEATGDWPGTVFRVWLPARDRSP